jgi:hypothetical protein
VVTGGDTDLGRAMAAGGMVARHGGSVVLNAVDTRMPSAVEEMIDDIWRGDSDRRRRASRRRRLAAAPSRGPA